MKILMTTWEYPPYRVGGIATHTYDLSRALVRSGHDVHVLTYGDTTADEVMDGVNVHRIANAYAPDTLSWSLALAHRMERAAAKLDRDEKFEVVHAHDWMMVPAAVGIKKTLRLPMIFTLHSTEVGRSGIHNAQSKMINDLEWYGTFEADQIITVGRDFKDEVRGLFNPPESKLHYIPNGVDLKQFDEMKYFVDRRDFAADWEKMVLFVGRLMYQKGIEQLLYSIPLVLKERDDVKFVIAGPGAVDHYTGVAHSLGIGNKAFFTGYFPEHLMPSLFATADVTVAPSTYEPFGIVALESSAARTPVVASHVGGFKETVIHERTGLHSYPGHSQSIADQLLRVIGGDSAWGDWMGNNGRKYVERNFTWDKISNWTTGVYGKAMGLWE